MSETPTLMVRIDQDLCTGVGICEEIAPDVNALFNFVADAVNIVGFDPFVNRVDFLGERS